MFRSVRDWLLRSSNIQFGLIFIIAFSCMALLAGRNLVRPSSADHFTQLALGWLEGRLHHEDLPTGYCDAKQRRAGHCKSHRHDDWARLWNLEVRPSSAKGLEKATTEHDENNKHAKAKLLQGFPCRTAACKSDRKDNKIETWWILGEGWQKFARGTIRKRDSTWYISFPPGPAVAMLPAVAIWKGQLSDVFLTCIIAALIPAVLWQFFTQHRGDSPVERPEHIWAILAWTFASPALWLGSHGRVWFTAQCFSALFLCLFLSKAWNAKHPVQAGIWLGMAIACRPINAIFAVIFYALEWYREQRNWSNAIRFLLPLGLIGITLAGYNWIRFAEPFEFGHRFLDIRWQSRMQSTGMFSWSYLARNLQCLLLIGPQLSPNFPFFRVSIHGLALTISSPWIFGLIPELISGLISGLNLKLNRKWFPGLAAYRTKFPQRLGLLLAMTGAALPSLFYHNSGQLQFSYRFAIDWLPFLVVILVFSHAFRNRALQLAVLVSMIIQGYGAYQFARKPGELFVTQPLGWPFEEEFRDPS